MVTILHGDDEFALRNALQTLIDQWQGEVVHHSGKDLTEDDLIQALQTDGLFGTKRLIILEDVTKTPFWENIRSSLSSQEHADHIVIWENRTIPPQSIRSFSDATIRHLKKNSLLYRWLDTLGPGSFRQNCTMLHTLLQNGEVPQVLFVLTARRMMQLLAVMEHQIGPIPDWQLRRLRVQAQRFSQEKLRRLIRRCVKIDGDQKSGRSPFPLEAQLELLLAAIDRSGKVE